jgi:hypothetical protein
MSDPGFSKLDKKAKARRPWIEHPVSNIASGFAARPQEKGRGGAFQ